MFNRPVFAHKTCDFTLKTATPSSALDSEYPLLVTIESPGVSLSLSPCFMLIRMWKRMKSVHQCDFINMNSVDKLLV